MLMKRTALTLTVILALLLSGIAGRGYINLVEANPIGMTPAPYMPSITISSDGSIEPTNTHINKTGKVYTLTGNITNYSLEVKCNNVTLDGAGFTLLRDYAYAPSSGIIIHSNGVIVKNVNVCLYDVAGILVFGSHNTITGNNLITVSGLGGFGIELRGSYNDVIRNTIQNCGIYLGGNYNNIIGNILNGDGIFMSGSIIPYSSDVLPNFNTIVGNTIRDCGPADYAVHLSTGNNIFCLNNFINNTNGNISPFRWELTQQGWKGIYPDDTIFDNGSVGNYWSDYKGRDANRDGIGDTPYVIGGNLKDRYPLLAPFDIENNTIIRPSAETSSVQPEPFPATLIVAPLASVAVIGGGLLVYFKKRQKKSGDEA